MRTITLILLLICINTAHSAVVTGTISDAETGDPIPAVTVRVEGTGRSMLANDVGQYRLLLKPGRYRLRFSHVAHHSVYREIQVSDSSQVLHVSMRGALIELPGITVFDRPYDPAEQIIRKAIAHKDEILQGLESYKAKAYAKLVVYDQDDNDSGRVETILESQLECFWKRPHQYKETIVARRQSANWKSEQNLLNIDNIPNFNMNRVEFGPYSIISPTATDALDHYRYHLLDTIIVDNRFVFRLEVEPKNDADPLVFGTIDILDSTFNVVGIEGGLGKGIYLPFVKNLRYSQRFDLFENRYWMPTEIHLNYEVGLTFPIQRRLAVDYVAALYEYGIDPLLPEETFQYALEVAETADDVDSATWHTQQVIPLTPVEKQGYARIDSAARAPKPLYNHVLPVIGFLVGSSLNYKLFHFNRVEGAYLGAGHYWFEPIPRTELDIKVGYAISREYWQQRYGVYYRPWDRQRVYIGAEYRDEIRHRPVILASPGFNPAIWNLFFKADPLDYYHERGLGFHFASDIIGHVRVSLSYRDYRQSSETNNTDYSFFSRDEEYRPNPAIIDGRLRSFGAKLIYDSRKRARIKGRDAVMNSLAYSKLEIGCEFSSPDLVSSDFDFVRYYWRFKRTGHTILSGLTTVELYIGGSDKTLPPQQYFTIDYTYKVLDNSMFFRTVGESNFSGNRVAAIYLSHNFGHWLFDRSGLPLIKHIPFPLSLNGGVFWTDYRNHTAQPGDNILNTASKPYRELGFSIGRVPPLNYRLDFTWQLSDYDTHRFRFGLGIGANME